VYHESVRLVSKKKHGKLYLVLVPHRDTRLVLRNYSASLFKAGFSEAFSFPWAAPLASLSHPLEDEELKNFSRGLREAAGNKISAGKTAFCAFDEEALFGPRLDIGDLPFLLKPISEKVTEIFSSPVIGSCLLPASSAESAVLPSAPELSFSAAAVANMYWQRTDEGGAISVKWKIGKLFWLPAGR